MLIANKPFTYATRRLVAGDRFEPRTRTDARVLLATNRARRADDAVAPPPPAPAPAPAGAAMPPSPSATEIGDLRKAYEAKFGKRPFPGWDAATLIAKMGAA